MTVDDESLAIEFIDLLTTLRLCVAFQRWNATPTSGVNRSLVRCCKKLLRRTSAQSNKKVLKNIIKSPYPHGQLEAIERRLMEAYN